MTVTVKKILKGAVVLLALHVATSLLFIVFPSWPAATFVSKAYKRYLLPGPFFTEARITHSYLLWVSWKEKEGWAMPVNPPLQNYARYFSNGDPASLYRSIMERDMYKKALLPDTTTVGPAAQDRPVYLKQYLRERYVPAHADSIKMVLTKQYTAHFQTAVDTLQTIVF